MISCALLLFTLQQYAGAIQYKWRIFVSTFGCSLGGIACICSLTCLQPMACTDKTSTEVRTVLHDSFSPIPAWLVGSVRSLKVLRRDGAVHQVVVCSNQANSLIK